MKNYDSAISPSETILLNAKKFASSSTEMTAFPLIEDGQFVDERQIGISLLTAAFLANFSANYISLIPIAEKSVMDKDSYLVVASTTNLGHWPDNCLEARLFNFVSSSQNKKTFLFDAVSSMLPRPGQDSPWRDVCWDVYYGLFKRGLLDADTIEFENPMEKGLMLRYRSGGYTATQQLRDLLSDSDSVSNVTKMIVTYRGNFPELSVAIDRAVGNLSPSLL